MVIGRNRYVSLKERGLGSKERNRESVAAYASYHNPYSLIHHQKGSITMSYPTARTIRTTLLKAPLDQIDAQRDHFLAALDDSPLPRSVDKTYTHAMAERRRAILTGQRIPLPKPYARWLASATAGLDDNGRPILQLVCAQEAHGFSFLIASDGYRAHILHFVAQPGLYVVDPRAGRTLCPS